MDLDWEPQDINFENIPNGSDLEYPLIVIPGDNVSEDPTFHIDEAIVDDNQPSDIAEVIITQAVNASITESFLDSSQGV